MPALALFLFILLSTPMSAQHLAGAIKVEVTNGNPNFPNPINWYNPSFNWNSPAPTGGASVAGTSYYVFNCQSSGWVCNCKIASISFVTTGPFPSGTGIANIFPGSGGSVRKSGPSGVKQCSGFKNSYWDKKAKKEYCIVQYDWFTKCHY